MLKLIWTKGLSGSGKTHYAIQEQQKDPSVVLVSKDELRRMLHADKWTGANEKQVLAIEDDIIIDSLKRNRSVIVHDTNLHPKHAERFERLAEEYKAVCVCKDLTDVPIDECIKRDLKREHSVGERVIRKQYYDFLAPKQNLKIDNPDELPWAVIVDLDGTLAHGTGRSYYGETEKYLDDDLNEPLAAMLKGMYKGGMVTLLVSGRAEECRPWTEKWLVQHNINYDKLYMRQDNDNRPDWIIKQEILDEISNQYCVVASIDDRPSVIRKTWVPNGIFTLSANQYEVEF